MTDFLTESNIFGEVVSGAPGFRAETASTESTAAGQLIDHLKYVADSAIAAAANRADWLALAANAGQNGGSTSFVGRQYVQPDKINSSAIVNGWVLPTPPPLLALPSLPSALTLNTATLRTDWQLDISNLQTSWMAQFLPAVTDVSALNALISNVLGGSAQVAFETKLTTLQAAVVSALSAIAASTLSTLNSSITQVNTNLANNITTAKANIAAALALAADNTQNIAWSRARDQAAREAKRLEDEAITQWASRGFALPGGVVTAMIQQQRQKTLNAASDAAAQQAIHIQTAFLEISKTTVDSWARTLEVQNRFEVETFRAVTETNIKYSELTLDANKFNADLSIKHLGLTLDFTKFAAEEAAKYRLGVIAGMNDLIRAYAALRGNEAEYARTIAGAQQQAVAALVEYYRAAMASADIGLRIEQANTDTSLRWASTAAQFIGTAVGHHVQAAAAAAEVFSRTAGMALSGLNGVASVASSA